MARRNVLLENVSEETKSVTDHLRVCSIDQNSSDEAHPSSMQPSLVNDDSALPNVGNLAESEHDFAFMSDSDEEMDDLCDGLENSRQWEAEFPHSSPEVDDLEYREREHVNQAVELSLIPNLAEGGTTWLRSKDASKNSLMRLENEAVERAVQLSMMSNVAHHRGRFDGFRFQKGESSERSEPSSPPDPEIEPPLQNLESTSAPTMSLDEPAAAGADGAGAKKARPRGGSRLLPKTEEDFDRVFRFLDPSRLGFVTHNALRQFMVDLLHKELDADQLNMMIDVAIGMSRGNPICNPTENLNDRKSKSDFPDAQVLDEETFKKFLRNLCS